MRTLLRIDASAQSALSYSRKLADYFEVGWRARYPYGRVVKRDLAREPLPHVDEATIRVFYAGGEVAAGEVRPPGIVLSDQLIAELKAADDLIISSAVYNFGMPSALKAWMDHIVRFGHTLAQGEKGPVGLLKGKRAYLFTARGGMPERSPEYLSAVVRAVLRYIGVESIDWISLEGTRMPDGRLEERLQEARRAIDNLFTFHHDEAVTVTTGGGI